MGDHFWLYLRKPGNVPERKGPFRHADTKATLREFIAARPGEFITVVTLCHDGPHFEDGPQVLEILDGRSRGKAEKHRNSIDAAFANPAPVLTEMDIATLCGGGRSRG